MGKLRNPLNVKYVSAIPRRAAFHAMRTDRSVHIAGWHLQKYYSSRVPKNKRLYYIALDTPQLLQFGHAHTLLSSCIFLVLGPRALQLAHVGSFPVA
jgi:hypothetical protein